MSVILPGCMKNADIQPIGFSLDRFLWSNSRKDT